jgi:ribosomal protein S18 acetylase RimI-like enzyme
MSVEIIPFSEQYIKFISRMHIGSLPTLFDRGTGVRLLDAYYSTMIRQTNACGFVALVEGEVAGFICGVWNYSSLISQTFKGYWWVILTSSIQAIIINPILFFNLLARFWKYQKKGEINNFEGYELRPIVIDHKYRGCGISALLISKLIEDAKKRRFSSIFLIVEPDNLAAVKLYQKHGFICNGKLSKSNQIYYHFTRSI